MPRTPDYFPGEREEESILFLSGTDLPTRDGQIVYLSGSGFIFREEGVSKTLSSSIGITSSDHKDLNQLVHLAEGGGPFGSFTASIRDVGPKGFPTATIWWTDTTRTKKIVQKLITYNSNKTASTIQWQSFNADGVSVNESYTDSILYDGVYETTRSRSIP